mmetsp:Transcript_43843/g.103668  ORF Transcript_43843/g.103668 Transcript_43843/m.103668 type:complete len:612 (+) Transcript_43843:100-1935(+)
MAARVQDFLWLLLMATMLCEVVSLQSAAGIQMLAVRQMQSSAAAAPALANQSGSAVRTPQINEVSTFPGPPEGAVVTQSLVGSRIAAALKSTAYHGSLRWWLSDDVEYGPSPESRLCCLIVGTAATVGLWVCGMAAAIARQSPAAPSENSQGEAPSQSEATEARGGSRQPPVPGAGLGMADDEPNEAGLEARPHAESAASTSTQELERGRSSSASTIDEAITGFEAKRVELLDTAKAVGMILLLVCKAHITLDTEPAKFNKAISQLPTPMLCFVTGLCSQGRPSMRRWRGVISRLIAPIFLWTFIVQPMVMQPLFDHDNWKSRVYDFLCGRQFHIIASNPFQEMPHLWYMFPALVCWRSSTLAFGHLLTPKAFLAIALAASCAAGYVDLDENPIHMPLNAVFGYLPYFAIGYICNLPLLFRLIPAPRLSRSITTSIFVLVWTTTILPMVFVEPLPDPAKDYSFSTNPVVMNPWDVRLMWARRLSKVVVDLVGCLPLLFCALPRSTTIVTEPGKHIMYPYMFQQLTSFILDVLFKMFGITGEFAWALRVPCAFVVLLLSTSQLWRTCWAWCLEPAWVDRALRPIFLDTCDVKAGSEPSEIGRNLSASSDASG